MSGSEATAVTERRKGPRELARWLTGRVKAPFYGLARVASRSYIAGDKLDDAIAVAGRLVESNCSATIGYWDGPNDSPTSVIRAYQSALAGVSTAKVDAYLSIKLPSLGYSRDLIHELANRAMESGVGLHFDALGPETVARTWEAIAELPGGGANLGCTLPGRWARSPADADWAVEHGLAVRVVKGQWPDPEKPKLDPRVGYLEVIERLAGRARRVAVASHDLPTARRAIEMLLAASTPTTLELLYGLPSRRQIEMARELNVPVRIYVPYGVAYLPYCLGQMKRNPRIAWWLLRDAIRRA
jgi:proline dehydrogenase